MELQTEAARTVPNRVAHRLPCSIHADGAARTARAFSPFPDTMTSFRGHALRAGDLQIPEGSTMVVVENAAPNGENRGDTDTDGHRAALRVKYPLHSNGHFYQHDEEPDANSAVPRALQWISMAGALHAPIEVSNNTVQDNADPPNPAES